jgi:hypothetical protein
MGDKRKVWRRRRRVVKSLKPKDWDNESLGRPISTFNEKVHPAYKIGFKDIVLGATATHLKY